MQVIQCATSLHFLKVVWLTSYDQVSQIFSVGTAFDIGERAVVGRPHRIKHDFFPSVLRDGLATSRFIYSLGSVFLKALLSLLLHLTSLKGKGSDFVSYGITDARRILTHPVLLQVLGECLLLKWNGLELPHDELVFLQYQKLDDQLLLGIVQSYHLFFTPCSLHVFNTLCNYQDFFNNQFELS